MSGVKPTADAIAKALRALPEPSRNRLVAIVTHDAKTRRRLDEAARTLADPEWAKGAVRMLDAPARMELRLLCRRPDGVPAPLLDAACTSRLLPEKEEARPSFQLIAGGLVWTEPQSDYRGNEHWRLAVLEPLRDRLRALAEEMRGVPPDPPSDGDELFAAHRPPFRLGVTLAAVASAYPRATRLDDLHRGDERALSEKLAALHGTQDAAREALRELSRLGLLENLDGRLVVRHGYLAQYGPPLAQLLLRHMTGRQHAVTTRMMVAELLAADGWVEASQLGESAAVSQLDVAGAQPRVEDLRIAVDHLRRTPGLLVREVDRREFWRASKALRQAFEGDAPPEDASARTLLVQANLQVIAPPGTPLTVLARLGELCRLDAADQVATFSLARPNVQRAAAAGFTTQQMLAFFERHSRHGVPPTVERALRDWSRTRGEAHVVVGAVLVVDAPEDEVRALLGDEVPIEPVTRGVFRLHPADVSLAVERLRAGGLACAQVGRTEAEPGSWRRTGPPDAAQVSKELLELRTGADELRRRVMSRGW